MTNEEFRHSFKMPFHHTLGLAVYSCGVQRCGSGHSWGPAVRDHYLIHCIVSGQGVYSCGAQEYTLKAGDGFVVSPNQIVSYQADKHNPWEYRWVGFHGSDAKLLMLQTGLSHEAPIFHFDREGSLPQLLKNICDASGPGPSADARMQAGLLLFLAELMDRYGQPAAPRASGYEYVKKAIRFIDFNYSRDIDIEDVAASAGISRSHLYRLFMENISMPPNEYLMRYRIHKAVSLLREGQLSVGEVAYSTGFSDQLYFSRVFKKYMGAPPSRYGLEEEKERTKLHE